MRSQKKLRDPTTTAHVVGLAAAFVIGLASVSSSIQAATDTTNLNVSASIPSACTVSVTALNFGAYSGDGTDMTATSTLTTSCSDPTTFWRATFDGGAAGTILNRLLSSTATAGNTWPYNIYFNTTYTQILGNTTGDGFPLGSSGGNSQTIYGLLPIAGSPAIPDTYTDTVVVTLTF